jgi:hypothetical protein
MTEKAGCGWKAMGHVRCRGQRQMVMTRPIDLAQIRSQWHTLWGERPVASSIRVVIMLVVGYLGITSGLWP